jgi:hypothetical protein
MAQRIEEREVFKIEHVRAARQRGVRRPHGVDCAAKSMPVDTSSDRTWKRPPTRMERAAFVALRQSARSCTARTVTE